MRPLVLPVPAALIGLFFSVAFAQTSLSLLPQQVSLAAPAGSTTRAVQTLSLATTGQTAQFNASVRYLGSAANWLSVSPESGTTPAAIAVSADASKLAAGTYFAQITVSAGALGTYANVLFTVGSNSGGGSFVANPSGLTFIGQSDGSAPLTKDISVSNGKGLAGAIGFTALASSSGWLSVSPFSLATPTTITVQADSTGLATGIYTGAITLIPTGAGNPTVVPVALAVTATSTVDITLSQTAVAANYQVGSAVPPFQQVDVDTPGYVYTYTASTTTHWIQLTNVNNATPSSSVTGLTFGGFGVRFDPTGLAAGTYTGSVTISVPGLVSRELPVTLTVTAQAALNAQPSSLRFNTNAGLTPLQVSVTSTGNATLAFTTSVGAGWLSVTPNSGFTGTGSTTLTITANATGLTNGTYDSSVLLTVPGGGQTFTIPVHLIVGSGLGSLGPLEIGSRAVELTGVVRLPNPSQTITIGSKSGTQNFTAAASSLEGWLAVDPFTGAAPGNITITANTAAVPGPGNYDGTVTITSLATGLQDTIPVTMHYQDQAIVATPSALNVTQGQWGVAPPAQTLQITANAPSTFTAKSNSNWITITPSFGSAPAAITVNIDPKGLPPGAISGSIQIVGPNNTIQVPVNFTLAQPPGPNVTPDSITLTHQLGSPAPAPVSIAVSSTGQVVSFIAASTTETGVNWLTIAPASGFTPSVVTARVNTALLVPGKQSGVIKISSVDGMVQRTIPVGLTVNASLIGVDAILHGATFAPTALAPGQIVTITGSGLGPAAGVSARPTSAGAIESKLGDVRVLVDGVPAPLLYVQQNQINAIMPYALTGRVSAKVQVESAGTSFSIPIEAKVADSAPGIFTVGSSGRGQAAALNADGTVNSLANPALRGSYISIFGSGEGQTDPPGQDGRVIITDLRRPMLPVTASIGGRPAAVPYIGSAPQLVSGVFQANLQIPEDIDAGVVPVQIQIGTAVTQSAVTIAVK